MANGIVIVDKPTSWTSQDVTARLRRAFQTRRIGHGGTLDPMATGVLPVFVGRATRAVEFFEHAEKAYVATVRLGLTTDTEDVWGRTLTESQVSATKEEVEAVLSRFVGKQMQTPPMYSAVKIGGKKLYELARAGKEIERAPREIEILTLRLLSWSEKEFEIYVACSKGTYIRTLIDDLGRMLGCGAVMTALVRTSAMGFCLESCVAIDELQHRKDNNIGFDDILLPVDQALYSYDTVAVSAAQSVRFRNGGALDLVRIKKRLMENDIYRVYDPNGNFLGLGRATENELKVERIYINK